MLRARHTKIESSVDEGKGRVNSFRTVSRDGRCIKASTAVDSEQDGEGDESYTSIPRVALPNVLTSVFNKRPEQMGCGKHAFFYGCIPALHPPPPPHPHVPLSLGRRRIVRNARQTLPSSRRRGSGKDSPTHARAHHIAKIACKLYRLEGRMPVLRDTRNAESLLSAHPWRNFPAGPAHRHTYLLRLEEEGVRGSIVELRGGFPPKLEGSFSPVIPRRETRQRLCFTEK